MGFFFENKKREVDRQKDTEGIPKKGQSLYSTRPPEINQSVESLYLYGHANLALLVSAYRGNTAIDPVSLLLERRISAFSKRWLGVKTCSVDTPVKNIQLKNIKPLYQMSKQWTR